MVQALAFAEIFLGLILADAGYKGIRVSRVVKGEAGAGTPPSGLGSVSPGDEGAGGATTVPAPGETLPAGISSGGNIALFPAVAAAKGILETKLKRKVNINEVGSLYEKYHPEKSSKSVNHPPTNSFEELTGALEP